MFVRLKVAHESEAMSGGIAYVRPMAVWGAIQLPHGPLLLCILPSDVSVPPTAEMEEWDAEKFVEFLALRQLENETGEAIPIDADITQVIETFKLIPLSALIGPDGQTMPFGVTPHMIHTVTNSLDENGRTIGSNVFLGRRLPRALSSKVTVKETAEQVVMMLGLDESQIVDITRQVNTATFGIMRH